MNYEVAVGIIAGIVGAILFAIGMTLATQRQDLTKECIAKGGKMVIEQKCYKQVEVK